MAMLKDIVIAEKVSDMCVCLKRLSEKDGVYHAVFSDVTTSVDGLIRSDLVTDEIKSCVGGAVKLSAVVKPGAGREPIFNVKQIKKANQSEYKSSDLFDGLSEEKIAEYISIIKQSMNQVKHEGFRRLLEVSLTDETLEKLSHMPATLAYYGRYKGGALAGAAVITKMVKDCGIDYVMHFNALHQGNVNWSLLLTASLLNTLGVLNYITPEVPFSKTAVGIERGYCSVLQSMLEKLVYQHNVPVSDVDLSRLLNVINCAVAQKTSVKATSKEGILLRHVLAMYAELDMLDFGINEHEKETEEETHFYNAALRRYTAV